MLWTLARALAFRRPSRGRAGWRGLWTGRPQSDTDSMKPLEGVRILDLTRVLAGPFATMNLGDLGAEVIKVERPGAGDDTRTWGPPFVNTESTYFLSVNRNKKLAAICDVFVENYVPGKLSEMGLGYEDIDKIAPHIIYCSITETHFFIYNNLILHIFTYQSLLSSPSHPPMSHTDSFREIVLWVTMIKIYTYMKIISCNLLLAYIRTKQEEPRIQMNVDGQLAIQEGYVNTLAALPEVLRSVSSTHKVTPNHLKWDQVPSSGLSLCVSAAWSCPPHLHLGSSSTQCSIFLVAHVFLSSPSFSPTSLSIRCPPPLPLSSGGLVPSQFCEGLYMNLLEYTLYPSSSGGMNYRLVIL
ncbi:Sugct [Phodopus roborovskii]|uniref:Sugct protein n=1 Tax=Phodopus roborovskii TaxID=109678 RepID=A0AAU9ZQI9_PHORO|nr:Sugct [Phodopus roborovskii]